VSKKIFLLLLIPLVFYIWTSRVEADSLGEYLEHSKYIIIYPFREKLEAGAICKQTGEDVDIIATKDDCIPDLMTENPKLSFPRKIMSSKGALDFMTGLSKDVIKTDLEAALNLAGSTEMYMDSIVLETEMVPSKHQLVKHMSNMAESSCYRYLSDNQVIHTVAKAKEFTFVFKDAKSGGIEAVLGAFVKAGIKGKKESTEMIKLESDTPWCIAYKAYYGKALLKEIEKRKEEMRKEDAPKADKPKTAKGEKSKNGGKADSKEDAPKADSSKEGGKVFYYMAQPDGEPEVEQTEASLRHFNLWK